MALEPVSAVELDALQRLDTCTVSNAVETFAIRLRNAGFADSRVRCMFDDFPPMVGYAATAQLRTGEPPIAGRIYFDRTDWWKSILQVPAPRVVVLEDLDEPPGLGAFIGEMHAAILRALGCVGYVTNGAVRELPRIKDTGLQLFAGNVAVSHAYAHMFEFGSQVKVGGLEVRPGDLLHGDRHGLLSIPKEIAAEIPAAAAKLQAGERRVIEFCRSPEFSVEKLRQVLKEVM
jgi:4-hydroxy-4-methyl-2-oxoglutarate aldolase